MNRLLQTIFSPPAGRRVYIAGRYARQAELREVAEELRAHGYEVTSRWLFQDASIPGGLLTSDGRAAEVASMDFDDVRQADLCIAFTEPPHGPQGRGGRHAELGIAIALEQRVLVVGPREHVFHCLSGVEQFDDWIEARAELGLADAERQPLLTAA